MPTLTDEIKTFIVKGLACYDTPSQVAEAVKAEFNIEITRQHVYAYDPNASQHMAPRWRALHAATRAALLRELAEIGIAHRAVRLRRLDRLASRSERNNVLTALKCFEMAAKECGGMYENRKPILVQPAAPQTVMPEQTAPQPAATPPAMPQRAEKQPSMPERSTPQPQRTPPMLSVPLPVPPRPDTPVRAAPPPLAVLAQPPQPPASPEGQPLGRVERYLAYVHERHARDRQARLDSAG
ncbi:DUF2280 domain-containing protein [Dongia sedimenti]|uniref:DUF2280 domain-containing protein n=1 Tax=Dongia sedimenti TaxID=3064282 RepID=A0ABU0YJ85_9PROT|nr:DUF2280 domain-containing protein [Rhodospirillaceae bacterium R-7]